MNTNTKQPLEHWHAPVQLKLAALWTSVMFCYIYCDYFELYTPGKLQEMLQARLGPLGPATQGVLVGTSLMMAIPSLMIFLSAALVPRLNRGLNLVFGTLYTLLMIMLAVQADWHFYQGFATLEAALTMLAVWYAWRWPRVPRTA
ncbi:hypothetical protein DEO45_08545 [Rhodanobacter denitrificans]|uniref:Uncharacterized protein n=1 Tax=Rhodanobacter denitrificans TaxID=666685 RepID=A0A368KE46_9GAMM|nr:DUF6326 family protein [Rhodanobacter denitrificans]RCS30107.1 hypothetical protein DEO45_08545 [Rhodanobacter denitrificans]